MSSSKQLNIKYSCQLSEDDMQGVIAILEDHIFLTSKCGSSDAITFDVSDAADLQVLHFTFDDEFDADCLNRALMLDERYVEFEVVATKVIA